MIGEGFWYTVHPVPLPTSTRAEIWAEGRENWQNKKTKNKWSREIPQVEPILKRDCVISASAFWSFTRENIILDWKIWHWK